MLRSVARRSLFQRVTEDPALGILLVAPAVIWVLFVRSYPLFDGLRLSFMKLRFVAARPEYIGLRNYEAVLWDTGFWAALFRSVWWGSVNTILQTVGSVVVAITLNQRYRGATLFRNLVVLPWVLPTVVLAIMWSWILDPTLGVFNFVLRSAGIVDSGIRFLGQPDLVMWVIILINVWRWTPYFAIIVLAALQGVPRELYEAAQVDGASAWRQLWSVTLPSIRPVLLTVALVSLLTAFNIFDTIWLLTAGGPLECTTTLPLYIYKVAFLSQRWGRGAAASVLMFLVLAVLTVVYYRVAARRGEMGL